MKENKWGLVDAFFDKYDLVDHHIKSYNDFVNNRIQSVIDITEPITLEQGEYVLRTGDVEIQKPFTKEADGSKSQIFPTEARLRNLTYSAHMFLEMALDQGDEENPFEKVYIGELPLMLKSDICHLNGLNSDELINKGEDPQDPGGYFIVNGSERAVVTMEEIAPNKIILERSHNNVGEWREKGKRTKAIVTSIKSGFRARISLEYRKPRKSGVYLRISFPYVPGEIPLVILLRALGLSTDEEIITAISDDINFQIVVADDIEVSESSLKLDSKEMESFSKGVYLEKLKLLILEKKLKDQLSEDDFKEFKENFKKEFKEFEEKLSNEELVEKLKDELFKEILEKKLKELSEEDFKKFNEILVEKLKNELYIEILEKKLKLLILEEKLKELSEEDFKEFNEELSIDELVEKFENELSEDEFKEFKEKFIKDFKKFKEELSIDELAEKLNDELYNEILEKKLKELSEKEFKEFKENFTNEFKKFKEEFSIDKLKDELKDKFSEKELEEEIKIKRDYYLQQSAIKFIGNKVAKGMTEEYRIKRAEDVIDRYLLPHMGVDTPRRGDKSIYLAEMCEMLLQVIYEMREPHDKDHYTNKRLRVSGDLMEDLFRVVFTSLTRDMSYQLERSITRGKEPSIKQAVRSDVLTENIKHAIATGNWVGGRAGVSQLLDRTSYMGTLSHLRRVVSPLSRSQPHFEARDLHPTQFGKICPNETPEGPNCGLVKNLALMCKISEGSDEEEIKAIIREMAIIE